MKSEMLKDEENIQIRLESNEDKIFYNVSINELADSNKIEIIHKDFQDRHFQLTKLKELQ